ncbi:MAG: serine hydrolase [Candidatus Thorarchaeota archaeon]
MYRKARISVFVVIIILCISIFGFQASENNVEGGLEPISRNILSDHPYGYQDSLRDYYPTDEWRSCTPEEQGMNSTLLNEMLPYIELNDWLIDSIIIIRGGYIIYEQYPNPAFTIDYYHTLQSVTKSFTSALIGLAIKEGYLSSVDETIVDIFSDRSIANLDERKERMTVEHLLTMSAGVEWDEWTYPYNDTVNNNLGAMAVSADAVDYFLDLPMVAEPGEQWVYNSGGTIVLGALIEKLSNSSLMDFTQTYLFDPIGISGGVWIKQLSGYYQAGGGLYLKPRDMARFGYLYLNGGNCDDTQVISQEWVLNSTDYHFYLPRYGYLWWLEPSMDAYQASGRYGQKIIVSPKEDMVVVFTASCPDGTYQPHTELYYYYIEESIIGPPRIVETSTTTAITITNQSTTTNQTTSSTVVNSDGILLAASAVALVVVALVILIQVRARRPLR